MSTISKTANLELTQYNGINDPIIYSDYTSDMATIDTACKALADDIDALEIDVNALKDRATALENFVNVATLNTTAQTVSEAINELVASDTALDNKIDGVADRVTTAEGDIAGLKTWKDDTVDPTLSAYDGRLDAIEAVIETVSTQNIDDMIARIDALEEKVNTNAQNIDTLTENYARLSDRVSDNESAIGTIGGNLATLTNRVAVLETCCQEVRATLVTLRNDIDKNASDIAGILTRLTRDESNIAGNANDIILLAQQQTTQAESINDLYDRVDALDPAQPASLYARVGALETVVGDNSSGLVKDVDDLETNISTVENDIDALEATVGDSTDGLIKDVIDLQTTVGDNSSGLVADVSALQTTIGDENSGMIKYVGQIADSVTALETTVGDSTDGLVKDVSDLSDAVGDITNLDTADKTNVVSAINELVGKLMPVGAITPYGGSTAPTGWLLCDGSAVSRTDYATLFAVVGTAFGNGDGNTTFNVPDMRECTTKGAGLYGGTVGAHVDVDGLAVGEFIDDRVQEHTHQGTTPFYSGGGSFYPYNPPTAQGSYVTNPTLANSGRKGVTTEVKAIGVNYIIKA